MPDMYVIGHVNPDMDSIASAMGYAWLLRERDGSDAVAARAGAINPQTAWALKRLNLDTPLLLTDASPRFETVTRRLDTTTPEMPLQEAWAIASRTGGVSPVVNEDGTPYGLITGWSLFSFFGETVGPNPRQHERTLADILAMPCREACDTNVPKFLYSDRIRDSINRILRVEDSDFWVINEEGVYVGVARQRDLLNPPRLRIVLVDHNEPGQALASLDQAELLEILDHHRLDSMATREPIRFTVDIVGSTSTLVEERAVEAGLSAPPEIAGVLLAGLLSDTLLLSSPTTTERDKRAAERLGRWAFVEGGILSGESIQSFGEQVLEAGAGLRTRAPEEIVSTDVKFYETGEFRFTIAQAEVTDLVQLEEVRVPLTEALAELREKRGMDFAILMVTDVVQGSSRLILANPPAVLSELPYPIQQDGTRLAEGVVSRKKQLLPTILSLLES
ncbi:MAG: DHH family phosphoesterase [Anaerolineales bacterium]|nr:DHH family phosphoesterase [Anaerolineales bacterium]